MTTKRLLIWMTFVIVILCLGMCTFGDSDAVAAGGSVLGGIAVLAFFALLMWF